MARPERPGYQADNALTLTIPSILDHEVIAIKRMVRLFIVRLDQGNLEAE
jgi:hypothetical protein